MKTPALIYRILIFIVFVLAGCRQVSPMVTSLVSSEKEHQILFFIFQMELKKPGPNPILLKSQQVVKGKVKATPAPMTNGLMTYVKVSLMKEKEPLQTIILEHPLFHAAEFTKPDGEYSRKEIELEQGEFFARFQYHDEARWVRVEEIVDNKTVQQVIFKINK